MKAMVTGKATGPSRCVGILATHGTGSFRWTCFSSRRKPRASNSAGKEPWLKGISKLSWQTFFRVCTEEMDDLSMRALKLVIEYCLEVLEEVEAKIQGRPSIARLEAVLNTRYAEQVDNKVYQYRWALRHPVVKEAITRAMGNRFASR